ncbi:MAG: lysine--tRNA ligase [Candidatus Thermoplasmatota archaeon]|nr:lysine--tRNA ligase [Candidatus Thermoplasmatota archaeon]
MAEQESDLRAQMRSKLEVLKSKGLDPYQKYRFIRTHDSEGVKLEFGDIGAEKSSVEISAAGRAMAVRVHGKAGFADLVDREGKIQLYFKLNDIGQDAWDIFTSLDRGDIIGVKGKVFRTKMGEVTIAVSTLEVLSKALIPFPEKFHGLQDVQTRYRQRYLDLAINDDVRKRFINRSKMIAYFREWLNKRDFLEIETPILQPLYGGALAKPFVTHHNYLDMDLYLRIAPELYHKRCIVGNLEKVYEIGKNFRNEDIDAQHYPEYTSIELYQAYADYEDIMDLTESLICDTAMHITGTDKIPYGDKVLDFSKPWLRITMHDAVKEHTGVDISSFGSVEEARDAAMKIGVRDIADCQDMGKIVAEIFDQKAQPHLMNPTFVIDHPVEVSPLAKRKRGNPDLVERFELFINGWEFANAFSELNDPEEQEQRFREQDRRRKEGDEEAHPIDSDYIRALEYGLPPTGGLGIGVDRLAMILTNAPSIKEVILFPHMKPETM